jgi:hypothetical protein
LRSRINSWNYLILPSRLCKITSPTTPPQESWCPRSLIHALPATADPPEWRFRLGQATQQTLGEVSPFEPIAAEDRPPPHTGTGPFGCRDGTGVHAGPGDRRAARRHGQPIVGHCAPSMALCHTPVASRHTSFLYRQERLSSHGPPAVPWKVPKLLASLGIGQIAPRLFQARVFPGIRLAFLLRPRCRSPTEERDRPGFGLKEFADEVEGGGKCV